MFTRLSYQSKDSALLEVNFIDNEIKWEQGAHMHVSKSLHTIKIYLNEREGNRLKDIRGILKNAFPLSPSPCHSILEALTSPSKGKERCKCCIILNIMLYVTLYYSELKNNLLVNIAIENLIKSKINKYPCTVPSSLYKYFKNV